MQTMELTIINKLLQTFLGPSRLKKRPSRLKKFWKTILFGKAILINTQPYGKTKHFMLQEKLKCFTKIH